MKHKIISYLFLGLFLLPTVSYPFLKGFIDSENHENRKYAEMPQLSLQEWTSFSQNFDTFFGDYLPYKNQLVMLNTMKDNLLGVGTSILEYRVLSPVIRGSDHWLFYNAVNEEEDSFGDYLCNNLYEEEQLKEIAESYEALQQKLKEYGSELVVFYAANKEQIYSEYMPKKIVPAGSYSRTDQLTAYIREHTDVPLLYTKEALLKEKDGHQLFFKYDTHWNNLGGFVGGQVINEYFHNEYVSLDEVTCSVEREDATGDLANLLSMGKVYNDDKIWRVDNYKEEVNERMTPRTSEDDVFEFFSDAEDRRSVLVVMDSFGYALMGSITKDFAQVTFLRDTSKFSEFITENQPDIVIIEIVERHHVRQETVCTGLRMLLDEG